MTHLFSARTVTAMVSAVGLAVASLLTPASTDPADARETEVQTHRLAGPDRYETAVSVSTATFGDGEAAAVFIANGRRFPDALAAPSVAGTYVGPILLVEHDHVPESVYDEIERLTPATVFVLGGPDAVSEQVEAELAQRTRTETRRLAGEDRFETAADIAREVSQSTGVGEVNGLRTAFLANGRSFPDALSVGPASYERRLPILLTETDDLPLVTRQVIEELGIERVVIAGGPDAVSNDVASQVDDEDTSVVREAGRDRTDTAVQVAEWSIVNVGFDRNELFLARGDEFADSLAAAPKAASLNGPVVLSRDPNAVSYDLLQFLVNAGGIADQVTAIGGTAALTDRVLHRTAEAAKDPVRTITYTTGTKGRVDNGAREFSEHVDWTLVDQRGWSLNNDYRYSQIDDPNDAELRIWLADPATVEAAAPACDDAWSCRVGDDIYINEDNWEHGTQEWNDEKGLDAYRHYVVSHEVGHWIGFDHIDCGDYWADTDGKPAPVMEQQSIDAGACHVETWPLQADSPMDPWGEGDESEFTRAYDLYPTGGSAPGTTSSSATTTATPEVDVA